MTNKFDELVRKFLIEAGGEMPPVEDDGAASGEEGIPPDAVGGEDMPPDEPAEPAKPASPEEMELAQLAIRALNFNIHSKDVNQYHFTVDGQTYPFEEISDYFERTKHWRPVLRFIEWVMNKFEGISSKWTERPEFRGKNILAKIDEFNKDPDQLLDNSKRMFWTKIIINCLLHSDPSFNLVGTDVTEQNLPEIFNLLKQHFGRNTRGLFSQEIPGPGNN
jgi:hypothetical protein